MSHTKLSCIKPDTEAEFVTFINKMKGLVSIVIDSDIVNVINKKTWTLLLLKNIESEAFRNKVMSRYPSSVDQTIRFDFEELHKLRVAASVTASWST